MSGSYFLLPTLIAVFISFLIVRAAAIALILTGLDKKRAEFQSLSAFTGTGFTTKEAESVVNNPLRRRIVSWLMILGNVGIVTVIVATTTSLVTSEGYKVGINLVLLFVGIYIIYRVVTHKKFMEKWETFVREKLIKHPKFEESTVEDLLHITEGYGLVKTLIKRDSRFVGKSLIECELTKKGLLVLGIERDKSWIPIPDAKEKIEQSDRLVVYGPFRILRSVFKPG